MIPSFLRSLAAQVRALVQSGKAVHVTDVDAAELDLIAGLDWDRAPMPVLSEVATQVPGSSLFNRDITARKITSADIAFGWLFAAGINDEHRNTICNCRQCKAPARTAVCAELAVLCLGMHADQYYDGPRPCTPYQGTIEDARTAWEWIEYHSVARFSAIDLLLAASGLGQHADEIAASLDLRAKYRHELRGMK